MPVEAAGFVAELNASNPPSGDPVGQGDDHIRLLKDVLKATFPNASSAVYFPDIVASQTANFSILDQTDSGKVYPCNAQGGSFTATLPAAPTDRTSVTIIKTDYSLSTVTVAGNGKLLNGRTSLVLTKGGQRCRLQYSSVLGAWLAELDAVVATGLLVPSGASSLEDHVIADGVKTVGSVSSLGTVAGIQYQALFEHLWNSYANGVCAVSSGRGLSARADWNANKTITVPNLKGKAIFGRSNMAGSAEVLTIFDATTVGNTGGADQFEMARNQLPDEEIEVTVEMDGEHHHLLFSADPATNSQITTADQYALIRADGSADERNYAMARHANNSEPTLGRDKDSGEHDHAAAIDSLAGGDQEPINNMPPAFIANIFLTV